MGENLGFISSHSAAPYLMLCKPPPLSLVSSPPRYSLSFEKVVLSRLVSVLCACSLCNAPGWELTSESTLHAAA